MGGRTLTRHHGVIACSFVMCICARVRHHRHHPSFASPRSLAAHLHPPRRVLARCIRLAHSLHTSAPAAPRPIGQLRPIVRGQTLKYNSKVRAGRGFTLDELRSAKVNIHEARGLGISVDHRRKNRNAEALSLNVDRLKAYRAKLVVFPRNATSKRIKKGDADKEKRKNIAKQASIDVAFPATVKEPKLKARKITATERDANVAAVLRKARTDALLWGRREKRAADKAAAAAGKKKQGDDAPAMEE
jgi:large subunit ribosomal protein L13e